MGQYDRLAFTGMGMVASLGLDVVTNCAAARAGLLRPREIEDFPIQSLQDGLVSGLIAHEASQATRGFEGFARLVRLMHFGLRDLLRQIGPNYWQGRRGGFYLSLPSPIRIYEGVEWIHDEGARSIRMAQRREAEGSTQRADDLARLLLARAGSLAGWTGDLPLRFATNMGRTGVVASLQKAAEDLRSNVVDVAVVGAVDTLLEEDVLVWLAETMRLKTANSPVGLQPGEGAAFLSLELEGVARRHSLKTLGVLEALSTGQESRPWVSGEMPIGDGLTQAISEASGPTLGGEAPWLVADHSGESYSALDWGHATAKLRAKSPEFGKMNVWYPAISFGDTDSAFGAIAICMVLRAFHRAYAPSPNALIAFAALGPARAALRIVRRGEV